jgi:hypothetical protein
MNMGQAAGQAGNSELAVLEKKHPFLEGAGLFFSKNGLFLLKFEPFCKSGGIVFRVQTTPKAPIKDRGRPGQAIKNSILLDEARGGIRASVSKKKRISGS